MWSLPAAAAMLLAVQPASPEAQVLAELNRARANPAAYAAGLREYRGWYRGRLLAVPGAPVVYETQEGTAPVDEAIAFLSGRQGDAPLAAAGVLSQAAGDHRAEQARDGAVGHAGSDGSGPGQRALRRGGGAFVGEVIAYGSDAPADMVRQLIVDDGVADRSHRTLLFDPEMRYAGVSCGAHPRYRTVCVVTLSRTPDGRSRYAGWDRDGRLRLGRVSRRTNA
jgi:uncharacterized protein YkwD